MKRKICIITGSRAEYGLLYWLMKEIKKDKNLTLQLIVTGMHLSQEFGLTYKEIEKDGFKINEKLEILLSSDSPVAISKSMGLATMNCAEAFAKLNPDLLVILGDRFEIFSAVSAALVSRIPIAHIHGGEVTEGAFDDAMRHSITKMSHLHFTATEEYRKRVIQLGEHPSHVFFVGALGLDNIKKLKLLNLTQLEKELDFRFNRNNLLVTFHPVTLEHNTSEKQFNELLAALDNLTDTNIIFTKTNADSHGRNINELIDKYVIENKHKAKAFYSLGQLKYLSTMQLVDAVVGNSSSGIIEAPYFKIGTINIGDRQKGRIQGKSIINCSPQTNSIKNAFKILYSDEFQSNLKNVTNPFDKGYASGKIVSIIKSIDLKNILKKSFYDLN